MVIDLNQMPANTRIVFEHLAEQNFISKYTLVGDTALSLQIIPIAIGIAYPKI